MKTARVMDCRIATKDKDGVIQDVRPYLIPELDSRGNIILFRLCLNDSTIPVLNPNQDEYYRKTIRELDRAISSLPRILIDLPESMFLGDGSCINYMDKSGKDGE